MGGARRRRSRNRGVGPAASGARGHHDTYLHGDVGRVMVVMMVVRMVRVTDGGGGGRRSGRMRVVVVGVGVVRVVVVMVLVVARVVRYNAGRGRQGTGQPVRNHLLEGQTFFSEFEINCSRFWFAFFCRISPLLLLLLLWFRRLLVLGCRLLAGG